MTDKKGYCPKCKAGHCKECTGYYRSGNQKFKCLCPHAKLTGAKPERHEARLRPHLSPFLPMRRPGMGRITVE